MVQDDGPQEPDAQAAGTHEERSRSRIWPGVFLIIVVLCVIIFVWWYLQRPQLAPLTAVKETVETPADTPETRPEPTVPAASSTTSAEESETSRVPDVRGSRQSAAEGVLRVAGYDVTVSEVFSASKASGFVVAQNPEGGTVMAPGETVAIVVSAGTSSGRSARMPDIVGLTQSSAESKVKAAGLVPYLIYGDVDIAEGLVISQWPGAGESVPAGSEGFIQIQLNN